MAISSTPHIAAVLAIIASCAMVITALGTHEWIKGCFSLSKVADLLIQAIEEQFNSTATVVDVSSAQQQKMCLYQGLFTSTISYNGLYHIQMPVDFLNYDAFIRTSVVFLCLSIACGILAVVILCIATSSLNSTYEKKNTAISQTRISILFTLLAFVMVMVAMSVYSACTSKMMKDPLEFATHIDRVMTTSMTAMEEEIMTLERGATATHYRKKRQLPDITNMDISMLFTDMEPTYEYSFVFGWVSTVGFFISVIMALWAHYHMTKIQQPQPVTEDKL